MTKTRWALLITAAAAAAAILLVLFQPWALFVDRTVDEQAPAAATGSGPTDQPDEDQSPVVLATGTFISHEHTTTGTVQVLELPDGSRTLRIEGLDTSNGPDLKVWLTDAPVIEGEAGWGVFDDGQWVDLGRLKGNQGSQNYAIPPTADLDVLTSVSIWCDRFNVSFGAAALVPAQP
jgi:hypothetical protein